MNEQFDLCVVGAGPAGYVAAIRAARTGRRVAVVEAREAGGTCLNRGCVPTKALLHAAELWRAVENAGAFGIRVQGASFDYAAMRQKKDETVAQLRGGVEALLRANGAELVNARAVVRGAHTVDAGGRILEAAHILVATGCRPARIPVEGIDLPGVVTSDELLDGGELPKSLVIIGGGVIGAEFASLYGALGVAVTVVEAQKNLLPQLDAELGRSLALSLRKRGIGIHTGASVKRIERREGELACVFEENEAPCVVTGERVLVSVGRKPDLAGLFDGVDVATERGYIKTDANGATSVPGIWAAGDVVCGAVQLAHAASGMGVNAVCAMFGEAPAYDLSVMPSCVYTDPEIASAGLDERTAQAQGIETAVGKFVMGANARTKIATDERCFVKVVFDKNSRRLLGAQLLCERATDMIGALAADIAAGRTDSELLRTVQPHPTFSEGIAEAIEDAFGGAVHAMPRRRTP
ncbi:MAG: dihydrolipoyl dehydrogenase [Oscillospiraceae bacterium]|nr:dihydrolipoyl dehydrogenase [Oscillospiraceae bacterium]